MAVVKLKKICLLGLAEEKASLIAALSKLGAVSVEQDEEAEQQLEALSLGMLEEGSLVRQLDPERQNVYFQDELDRMMHGEAFNEAITELFVSETGSRYLARLGARQYRRVQAEVERRLKRLREGIATLSAVSEEKKPLFKVRRPVRARDFEAVGARQQDILQSLEHFEANRAALRRCDARRAALRAQIQQFSLWENFSFGVAQAGEQHRLAMFFGTIANRPGRLEDLESALEEAFKDAYVLEKISETERLSAVFVALRREAASEGARLLRRFEFTPAPPLPEPFGRDYAAALRSWKNELRELEQEEAELSEAARVQAGARDDLELLHDYYLTAAAKLESMQRLLSTGRLFVLQGYVPAHMGEGVKRALEEAFSVSVELSEIPEGEPAPVALHNRNFLRPYESIVEMFSLPSSTGDIDPTPVMGPFYAFFFGVMLSDAGYGLLMALICLFMLYRLKVEGTMRSMLRIFLQGSVAAIVFGLLFGSFFGDLLGTLSGERIRFPMLWFDPMEDPVKLMVASVVFGAVHIFAGMGVKFYMLWRTGARFKAFVEVVPWYCILIGLALMGLGLPGGNILALAGAGLILLFSATGQRNPVKRVFSGLWTLYGITGYVGDLLSYTRILALTLATSVIAMVVNILASLMGSGPVGIVFCLLVMLLGHGLNLALSALSAYVHATRLQYVEFFGKFYEGGGRRFEPLRIHTRFTRVVAD